ncbi:capsid portal protein [Xanthomonas arboricola]|nr:capsid portal protein [Xanthomonas sp. CFBP 8152]
MAFGHASGTHVSQIDLAADAKHVVAIVGQDVQAVVLPFLRIPPQLMGNVSHNAGGFGSIREAAAGWAADELEPLQARMVKINGWVDDEVIASTPMRFLH